MEIQTADQVWARIARAAESEDGATTPPEGRGVVATDADGTLWGGDVGEDLFHAFIERGDVREPALLAMRREARDHALSDAGTGSDVARRIYAAYVKGEYPEERVCELMAWCFAGWTHEEVAAFAAHTVHRTHLEERLHGEMLHVLSRARAAGLEVLLVSASPIAVVRAAGAHAGFGDREVVAARPAVEGDVLLPAVERPIPYGAGKVTRLRERIGRGRTIVAAFGDNVFDVDLLASASVPVAVRPKARLLSRAGDVRGLVQLAPEGPARAAHATR